MLHSESPPDSAEKYDQGTRFRTPLSLGEFLSYWSEQFCRLTMAERFGYSTGSTGRMNGKGKAPNGNHSKEGVCFAGCAGPEPG